MSDSTSMSGGPAASAAISVGAVIKRTFSVFLANLVPFSILALVLQIPALLYNLTTVDDLMVGAEPDFDLGGTVILLVSIVLSYVLMAALVYGTVAYMRGRPAGIGQLISSGLAAFFPVLIIAILASLIMGVGLVLLIVPGVFAIVIFAVTVPAYVVEKPGIIGSFKRSMELTKGNRWQVLGVLVILFVVLLILGSVFGLVAGVAVFTGFGLSLIMIVNYVVSAISSALLAVAVSVLYHDLRIAKEGVDTEQIAAVFD
ncbi:hypothetical protein [Pelagibius sp.]|uniref:hypothetical protein n=1 Tax=Pelagibius sp. TaxID=1931238 RepID=UPI003BB1785D